MIHDEICTYEVAKLAKEKGFNEECRDFYCNDKRQKRITRTSCNRQVTSFDYCSNSTLEDYDSPKEYFHIAAPTQSLLQKWLRETHNLHTDVGVWEDCDEDADGLCCGTYSYWSFKIQSCLTGDLIYEEFEHRYNTYEQAFEDALKYALENLV